MANRPDLPQEQQQPQEENFLSALTAIKAQINQVLVEIQQAKLSAASTLSSISQLEQVNLSPTISDDTPPAVEMSSASPLIDPSSISRDDVKAQREAKKAAKAARKNKSLGDAPAPPLGSESAANNKKVDNSPVIKEKAQEIKKIDKPKPPKQEKTVEIKVKTEKPEKKEVAPTTPVVTTPTPLEIEPIKKPHPKKSTSDLDLEKVHPKFRELGLKFSKYLVRGSNLRTVALFTATKDFLLGYKTPEGKGFKQDVSAQLQHNFDKLKLYRPFAVGMATAVEGINSALRALPENLPDSYYRDELISYCEQFVEEKITKAVEAIAQKACEKVHNGDTILVFSLTDAIFHTFKLAGELGKSFSIILAITKQGNYLQEYKQLEEVMGSPVTKGKVNISCINISSIMSFIPAVDKVFLGGHALFTTGGVMSHAGSSTIALCASVHNVPVIFFCETYKFCDKSPTDAFYSDVFPENKFKLGGCGNGSGEEVGMEGEGEEGVVEGKLFSAQICYDVTPVSLVTCVITDIDMLPSSSVPVVLRVQESRPLTKF